MSRCTLPEDVEQLKDLRHDSIILTDQARYHILAHAVFGVREGIRDAEREKLARDAAAQGTPVEVSDLEKVQK